MTAELEWAFDDLLAGIADATTRIREHEFYRDHLNRPRAHTFLLSMLVARLEEHVFFDPAFPYFRVLDHRIAKGATTPTSVT